MKSFEELGVSAPILQAIDELGFAFPMPVQEAVIPQLLTGDHDLIALAQTGTGKTAAFGIPILQHIDTGQRQTQAVVVSPTRELCLQIVDDLRDFARHIEGVHIEAVYGGAGFEAQMRALKRGVHIIVATPGRLVDMIQRGVAQLDQVRNIILDEADEMLNMGFSDSINAIFEALPEDHHTLMFSATMSREVERVAKTYLKNHQEIVVGSRNEGAENVNHVYYLVHSKDKYLALKRIVDFNPKIFAIVFCRTKIETQDIADKLIRDGYNAEALHGDLSQPQRDLTMQKFRSHLTQLLVATDVAARGLDVDDLTHVINFGLPDDIESYTHRSGRTGRAGKKGTSISIVHSKEKHKIRAIEKEIGKSFVENDIPGAEEICKKQLYRVMDQIVKTDVDEEQIAPFIGDISRYFEYFDKEDVIKKIVSREFGRFLAYYADAPEIEKPVSSKKEKRPQSDQEKQKNKAQKGYRRLFINLGKNDGFYPGELMQLLNRVMPHRQEVGHIDLLPIVSYFEVPEKDARQVMQSLTGLKFHGRNVRCNDADRDKKAPAHDRKPADHDRKPAAEGKKHHGEAKRNSGEAKRNGADAKWNGGEARKNGTTAKKNREGKHDRKWYDLKGEFPDFTEEGWARRERKK